MAHNPEDTVPVSKRGINTTLNAISYTTYRVFWQKERGPPREGRAATEVPGVCGRPIEKYRNGRSAGSAPGMPDPRREL